MFRITTGASAGIPIMTELTVDTQRTTESRIGWKRLGREDYLLAGLTALFCVLMEQLLQVRVGLNLADEGFLWYGVQRVLAGEVPVRDFQAYEPGRYYMLAGWARMVQSDGIVAMRCGLAVVQWAALFPALLLAPRATSLQMAAAGVRIASVVVDGPPQDS